VATSITLPASDGRLNRYELVGTPITPPVCPSRGRIRSREVYAAAHIVIDPLRSSTRNPVIDWDATLQFRHHLWSLGLGVADAMDTAQRGQGFPADQLPELVRRTVAEAADVNGSVVFGVATDQLSRRVSSIDQVTDAYLDQLATVEAAEGRAVIMASRQLASIARDADDYAKVYGLILAAAARPIVLHWLGEQFDPALSGYWGSSDFSEAAQTVLDLIRSYPDKIRGIKLSVLSVAAEEELRAQLPAGVHMFTGDDYNYPELILGTNGLGSDALLGAFDPLATVASAAFARLDANDADGFSALLEPTLPLSRHIFGEPTHHYKTGVVFLAYLNGHQNAFRLLGGAETARTVLHLCEAFRLADQCGALTNPDLAVERISLFLSSAGVDQ